MTTSLLSKLLAEGGWQTTKTQGTKLKPALVEETLKRVHVFLHELNKHLATLGLEPLKGGDAVGSTAYHQKDKTENPDKEYGDIDCLVSIPKLKDLSENKVIAFYKEKILDFIKDCDLDFLDKETNLAKKDAGFLIVKVGKEYVQADLIFTFYHAHEWARTRLTPERGVKGVLYGTTLASLGDALMLSIQTAGVQAKIKDGKVATYKSLKYDELKTISLDIKNFMRDIFNFIYKNEGHKGKPKIDPLLEDHSGINPEEVKISDIVMGIRGLAKTFTKNKMWGQGHLAAYENEQAFTRKVAEVYAEKIEKSVSSVKFDKAETPDAKAKADQIKEMLKTNGQKIIHSILA